MKTTRFLLLLLLSIFYSCKSDNSTVVIGNDEWMTENLSVKKFNNGDPIPEAKTEAEWLKAGQSKSPAYAGTDERKPGHIPWVGLEAAKT